MYKWSSFEKNKRRVDTWRKYVREGKKIETDLEEGFFRELSSHKERYSVQAPFNGRVNYLPVPDQQGRARSRLQPGRTVSGNTRFAVLEAD